MIAVDTSALMAIVLHEPERAIFLEALQVAENVAISAGTLIELRLVCHRRGREQLVDEVDQLLEAFGIAVLPVSEEQTQIAHEAFVAYGRGSGHPARLNFGDLFSYALAKTREAPLLFKGSDFAQTDIEPVLTDD